MVEQFFQTVFSEYGVFATFLLLTIAVLLRTVQVLWKDVKEARASTLEIVENNTRVLTQLVEKLNNHDN